MRIWHRLLGIFLLSESVWYVYAVGFGRAFGDIQTAFLVLVAFVIGLILTARG